MAKEQAFYKNGSPAEGIAFGRHEFSNHPQYLMGTVHVWLWRRTDRGIEVMLQKRALTKKVNPGKLSTSAAGHVDASEDLLQTAIRETREEIGLVLDPDKLSYAFSMRYFTGDPRIVSLFTYEVNDSFVPRFDDGEVDSVVWMRVDDFITVAKDQNENNLGDHGDEYYAMFSHYLRQL